MPSKIPFNRPYVVGREFAYIQQAIEAMHLSGDGQFSKQVHERLRVLTGAPSVLLTTSCTHALEMMALLLTIEPGDEIIVPSFTFASTANAFVLRGGRPVFADCRSDTFNLDETRLDALCSTRTRAIVVVHYAGVGCEMDAIVALAARRGITVLEDNAHGLLGTYRGRQLGTFGALASQSFHETKNFSCGEGGALIVNDEQYQERAEIIREKGTNRTQFFRGLVDKYTWMDVGSSYLPSEILAAFLLAQLEAADDIQARRQRVWNRYAAGLGEWAAAADVRLPIVPEHCGQAFHMFYLLLPDLAVRQRLMAQLRSLDIHAAFHYVPLHLSPMGQSFGSAQGDCPEAERASERLLRLPFFSGLALEDQDRVIDAICQFQV